MNPALEVIVSQYPTIYESVYEVVANSLAAKYTFLKTPDDFSEEMAEQKVEEMFLFNQSLGLTDSILVHSWFKDCCQYAADTISEVIESHQSSN